MKSFCILIISLILLSGCTNKNTGFVYEEQIQQTQPVAYNLYTKTNTKKILTGAYIGHNREDLQSISAFESFTDTENQIYVISLDKGMDFPYTKFLECLGNNKIPMLMVSKNYDLGDLFFVAKKCGEYNIPIYVSISCISENDTLFFKTAANIFREYAPRTEMVWCIDTNNYISWLEKYPGDEWVSYIGINFCEKANEKGLALKHTELEYLLNVINKPVIINSCVSHYSALTNKYYTYEATKELSYIFELPQTYSNIKAIIYINYPQADKYNTGDNFNLVPNKTLANAYKEAVNKTTVQYRKNKKIVYEYNNNIYVSKITIKELNLIYKSLDFIKINDTLYYQICSEDMIVDKENYKIFLNNI